MFCMRSYYGSVREMHFACNISADLAPCLHIIEILMDHSSFEMSPCALERDQPFFKGLKIFDDEEISTFPHGVNN